MDIHEKILQLRKVVPENGATEAEAMTALGLAQKLMDKHGVTEEDLKRVEFRRDMREGNSARRTKSEDPAVKLCGVMVGRFCEVICWWSQDDACLKFFGMNGDVEMAEFLMELVSGSMKRSWTIYLAQGEYDRETTRHVLYWSFRQGFADRINAKLREMIEARKVVKTNDGTSLVVVKDALVEVGMKEILPWIKLKKRKGGAAQPVNLSAYLDGKAAGERVNLNRPVGEHAAGGRLLT